MTRSIILGLLTLSLTLAVATTTSCIPRHPGRPGIIVLPGHDHGRGPKPKVHRGRAPFAGAVWVPTVWHWNGKIWTPKKKGYWAKPAPRGKAKGHSKKKWK